MDTFTPTGRPRVGRPARQGAYDQPLGYSILGEDFVCPVGLVIGGQPPVIPTLYARGGDELSIRGSAASHRLPTFGEGRDVRFTAGLVDGLVLARSAPHRSIYYRRCARKSACERVRRSITRRITGGRCGPGWFLPGSSPLSRVPIAVGGRESPVFDTREDLRALQTPRLT
jgi:hypothetical protein